VGATPSPYLDVLRAGIAGRGLASVRIIDQVSDARPYFAAADVFVCSSFEEALPRVVLEAAAFGLPIISTNVNGIPEILSPESAWLVAPGDARGLARAMSDALKAHAQNDHRRPHLASRTVRERFSSDILLPIHAELVRNISEAE
jgi:glycosyltransferase involved in cell wall biosynthesis